MFFENFFKQATAPERFLRELNRKWGEHMLEDLREKIEKIAGDRKMPAHEFAGTLLVGVFHKQRSVFYQVGDGVWCVSKSGVLGAVTWPEQGEYVGQTAFVTSSSALSSLQFAAAEGTIDYIVGMTDGLERLSLDLQNRVPHLGFCGPLINRLKQAPCLEQLRASLDEFLSSGRVCERTDDDKSLALITHEDVL